MIKSYSITVQIQPNNKQTIHLQADSANLLRFLSILDASPTVIAIAVTETITLPDLTKLNTVTKTHLGTEFQNLTKLR